MARTSRETHDELLRPESDRPRRAMTRGQLVDRILELNPTATSSFLDTFSESSLAHYLEHLCIIDEPQVPWVRRGIAPAIVQRESLD